MQIIIPMSGFGERFRCAGYTVPKPLIEIDNKPIIAHVIDLFPGESNFIFICNQEHLNEPSYQLEAVLKSYCPSGKIVGIPPHKLGPINAVRQIEHLLEPSEPVIVNYCDFTCYWDWHHFKHYLQETACSGAIPAYKGFHPHSLGNTNYAYMREEQGWVHDIQEKRPFTNNRMEEYASSGTYYFASAQIMSQAFREVMTQDLNVGGEYYVSLAYKSLLAKKQPVAVYPLQHFMQWGTPEDVAEYKMWSKMFRGLIAQSERSHSPQGALVLPMAGLGQRFAKEGYALTKPLIPVSGLPMVVQATRDLPTAEQHVFVLRQGMSGYKDVARELKSRYPKAIIKIIDRVTEGQACTALIGLDDLEYEAGEVSPITIGACDHGALYNVDAFNKLINDKSVDVIVWGVRAYPNAIRNPHMFGWIDAEDGLIRSISVKTPLDNPRSDPIVLGTFTFRKSDDYRCSLDRLIARAGRINGEFYIDSLINDAIALGLRCHLFEVDSYLCWGTPNDLRTFEYWQSCFHKWMSHPYRLELDSRIPKHQINLLEKRYQAMMPVGPEVHA
ncbi:UDP-N-acetylglucosamine diphosphorylase/glucosamine-1-phosphate N-acetyltransferase [Legionella sainthelensi]|uniref:sugar phosphate nucleotidyltransferase n=1 Tax=Legionella sainthelensi TaxID=28087 RepID=UPI000F7031F4|nr:sugar phosphate nucleotidyltransferase [Legionella sainthelensi]VEB38817.1 UDP-N-acetylglucosamine diphosphorylase/glucosamine-1-phosphate N-acetyltransferase [Legionella sainthelensi]